MRLPKATRGEGHVAPPLLKDPTMTSYGCCQLPERRCSRRWEEKRCNIRSTFKMSKYNGCNKTTRLLKHFKHATKTLEKTLEMHCRLRERSCNRKVGRRDATLDLLRLQQKVKVN